MQPDISNIFMRKITPAQDNNVKLRTMRNQIVADLLNIGTMDNLNSTLA